MVATRRRPRRVLLVVTDSRVRHALSELISSTPGLISAAAVATAMEAEKARAATNPAVALVDIEPANLEARLVLIRTLSKQMPIVAVSPISSLATRAVAAGAVAFCETDGNSDALVAALRAAVD